MMTKKTKPDEPHGILLKDIELIIQNIIRADHPDYTDDTIIDFKTLLSYRLTYLEGLAASDSDELKKLEAEIINSIKNNDNIAEGSFSTNKEKLTVGQIAADKIAKFGGSWPFILSFLGFLMVWIAINTTAFFNGNFDPYPFILLNLILSCLAAIQAPIIMMSQNRQSDRDRAREINDYKVNLKAEVEIKLLHEKLDYILDKPWSHLVEIQSLQVELLQQIQKDVKELK